MTEHTDLNDQMIVSIFSHLSRTINHREIGYFRDRANPKYQDDSIASKAEVDAFLARYQRFERLAKQYGIVPQEAHFQLVQKACEAMKAAVALYNNPQMKWKSEIFIVNAVIAWTYLMHAYFLTKGVRYIYVGGDGTAVTTDNGRPKHWELTKCLNANECPLPSVVKRNLEYLILVRNEIEHRLSDNVDPYLAPKLQACALNFDYWLCEWFGPQCSIAEDLAFAIQFAQLTLTNQSAGNKGLPSVIETANRLLEGPMTAEEYNDPRYSYRVYVVSRTVNNKNKADQAVLFAAPGSDVEMAIREVERPKFTAGQIVDAMRAEGFTSFSVHGRGGFVEFWQSIEAKKPGRGLGVQVASSWYWYDNMVGEVRAYLRGRAQG